MGWRWLFVILCLAAPPCFGKIPTTADGPIRPVTVPLDERLSKGSDDLPNDDPLVAKSVPGFFPEQIALAQGVDSQSMFVSWVTGEFQIGKKVKPLNPVKVKSIVLYGTWPWSLNRFAVGESLVYNQLYPFEGMNNYTSGIIHHVKLEDLKPDTTYYYKCGDPFIHAMSKVHSFRTLPAKGPNSYPKRIGIVGDIGLTYNSTSTIQHLTQNKPDINLFLGDLSYANLYVTNGTGSSCYKCAFKDTPIHETFQPRWDYWGRYLESLTSQVPTMVIEGNHEYELQAGGKTFEAYKARFSVPYRESGSKNKLYYSFNAGGAHIIMLGGYADYRRTSEQYAWLQMDLMNVDREETPWLIVAFHQPWYSSYKNHYREGECMRQAMEEILYKFGVDIIFTGHVHAYERMNLVYNYEYDKCAPLHIVVGDGGNREGLVTDHADDPGKCPSPKSTVDKGAGLVMNCAFNFTSGPAAGKFCWDRQPDWSAFRDSSFGHGILEIESATKALWTWRRNQDTYRTENHVGDQVYIIRQPDVCPNRRHKYIPRPGH